MEKTTLDPSQKEAAPTLIRQLARNNEEVTHLAKWQGKEIAVRVPLKNSSLAKELYVFKMVNHPHVLNCLGEIPKKNWTLLPYMERGRLSSIIFDKEDEPFLWPIRWQVSCDIAAGLQCLHSNGIIHCNIQPSSVLVDKDYRAKIASFGKVQIAKHPEMKEPWGSNIAYWSPELIPWIQKLPPETSDLSDSFPEAVGKPPVEDLPPFSEGSDSYALGTLFWEIAQRSSAASEVEFNKGQFTLSEETPPTYRRWIERCRAQKVGDRPLAADLFQEMSLPSTKEKLLKEVADRLALTQALNGEVLPENALFTELSRPGFIQYLFPLQTSPPSLTEKQQEDLTALVDKFALLQEAPSLPALKQWQLDCDCLLTNKVYWAEMSAEQRHLLRQLVCQYGLLVHTDEWFVSAKEHWGSLERYVLESSQWENATLQHWLLGFAEIRMYGSSEPPLAETIAFLQMARQRGHHSSLEERLGYAETVIHLSLLWKTLHQTLKTETDCRFYEVAKYWFAFLKETKERFASSKEPFINISLDFLLETSAKCVRSLIPRVHDHFALLLRDAKMSSPQTLQGLESDLVQWYQNYPLFWQWDLMVPFYNDVLKPSLELHLQEARDKGTKEFEEAVAREVEPWLKRYAPEKKWKQAEELIEKLIEESYDWVRSIAVGGSKAINFDSRGFRKRIDQIKLLQTQELQNKENTHPLWQALDRQREKFSKDYSRSVIDSLEAALKAHLPFLGEPPKGARWALIGLGSLGRGQLLPYSDLDVALLVESEAVRGHPYWQRLIHLFEALTQMMDGAGYWDPSTSSYVFLGHHIDAGDIQVMQSHDEEKPLFIQTPQGFAHWVVKTLHQAAKNDQKESEKAATDLFLAYSCLHPVLLTGTGADLLASYQAKLKKALQLHIGHPAMGMAWQQEHGKDWQRSLTDDVKKNCTHIKESVFAPLNYYWLDNGLLNLLGQEKLFTDITLIKKELEKTGHSPYWLNVIQTAWKEAFQLRIQLEQRAQGRIALVKKTTDELTALTPAEQRLSLTAVEIALIERLQGIAAIAYNAILHSHTTADPFQTDKKGICTAEIHPDLQELWVQGAAAALTFGKEQDLKTHRALYRLMSQKMRVEYEKAVLKYSQLGLVPQAKRLLENILPHVPLPNGNRGSFRLRQEKWQALIQSLVELCDVQNIPKDVNGVVMSWVEAHKTYHGILKKEFSDQLFDKNSAFKQDTQVTEGRRAVIPLRDENKKAFIYSKAYPELPGRQLAADCLSYRLTGSAVQASLVLFTPLHQGTLNEKAAYPVLLSKSAGKTIQKYIRKKEILETKKLDSYHFTLKVLATYLIGYEDDKKDNVTLIEAFDALGNPCLQLISIDSDHAFFQPMVDTTVGSKVLVKTVTFAFPTMNEPLDPEAIADFLSLNKQLVLEEWLGDCRSLSSGLIGNLTIKPQRYGLFKPEMVPRWFKLRDSSFIPVAFEPGTITDLYQRWMRLESALQTKHAMTHFDLLKQVSPRFAHTYQKVFNEQTTIAQRFDTLADMYTDYKVTKDEQQITHTSTYAVNVSKTLVGVKKFQDALLQGKFFDASEKHGAQELKDVQTHYQQLSELKEVFKAGIDIDDNGQADAIKKLELLLSKPYYSALIERVLASARFQYTETNTKRLIAFQNKLLDLLTKQSLQHLTLVGWYTLTEEKFLRLIEKSSDLQSLTLIDCHNFRCSALTWARLSVKCPQLKKIRLSKVSELPLLQWVNTLELPKTVKFDALESLYLENCPDLTTYQVNAPKLQKLTLQNCPQLTQLELSGQPISILRLKKCRALSDSRVFHDKQGQHLRAIAIFGCENLKFTKTYKKWPFLFGQFGFYGKEKTLSELLKIMEALNLKPHEIPKAVPFIAEYCEQARQSHKTLQLQLPKIQKALLAGMKDKDEHVRAACASALGTLGPFLPQEQQLLAFQALLKGFEDKDEYVCKACASALEALGPSLPQEQQLLAYQALLKGMDWSTDVRKASATALGALYPTLPQEQQLLALQALLKGINDKKWDFRAACASALGALSQEQQPLAIQGLLGNWYVHTAITNALGVLYPSLPQEQQLLVYQALLKGINDKKWDFRAAITNALGALYPSLPQEQLLLALQALLKGIKDKKWDVREASASALGALGPSLPQEQLLLALQALLAGMKNEEGWVRKDNASALGALGPSLPQEQLLLAYQALLKGINDEDWRVREACASGLGALGSSLPQEQLLLAFQALLAGIKDKDKDVRTASASALGALGPSLPQKQQLLALQALFEGIKDKNRDEDGDVRAACASTFGTLYLTLSQEQQLLALPALLVGVKDGDRDVRAACASTFGTLYPTLSQEQQLLALQALLTGVFNDACISSPAISAKKLALGALYPSLKPQEQQFLALGLGGLAFLTQEHLQTFLSGTKDGNEQVSVLNALAIGTLYPTLSQEQQLLALQTLLAGIKDGNEQVSVLNAFALEMLYPILSQEQRLQAFQALLKGVKDGNRQVSVLSLRALGTLGPSLPQEQQLLALQALLKGMQNKKACIREASASALGALGPSLPQEQQLLALQALLAGIKDGDSDVRQASARALGTLGPSLPQDQQLQALQALFAGLKDEEEWGVRWASATALGALEPTLSQEQQLLAFQALLTGIKDASEYIRWVSATALRAFDPILSQEQQFLALQVLLTGMKDGWERVREACVSALGALGPSLPQEQKLLALQALLAGIKDEDRDVRTASAEALRELYPSLPQEQQLLALQALLARIKDERWDVRVTSASGLGALGLSLPQEQLLLALQALLAGVKDEVVYVREACASALRALYPSLPQEQQLLALQPLLAGMKVCAASVSALGALGPSLPQEQLLLALQALLEGVKDEDRDVRTASAEALGALGPSLPQEQQLLALQALLAGMKDKDVYVREASASALGALYPSLSQEQLLLALQALLAAGKDESEYVRANSASALGALGPFLPQEQLLLALQALLAGMKDWSTDVRKASASGLEVMLKNISPIIWFQQHLLKPKKLLKTLPMPSQAILRSEHRENAPKSEEIANQESSDIDVEQPQEETQAGPIWYSDTELEQLLQSQLPSDIQEIKGGIHLWARVTTPQELTSQLDYAIPTISTEKLIISIIPIFLNAKENDFHQEGNHWAVLMLVSVPQQGKEPRCLAIYQNPLGLKIPGSIDQLLKGWQLYDLQLKQQTNDNDCGPWVVHSIVSLVEKFKECQNLTLLALPNKTDLQECIRPITEEQGDQLRQFYHKLLQEKSKPEQPKLANEGDNISLSLPTPQNQDDKGKEEMSFTDD